MRFKSPTARSVISIVSASASLNNFLSICSRMTPIRIPFCVVRVAEGAAERASRVGRAHLAQIRLADDDRTGVSQALDEGRVARRTIVRIRGIHARGRAHIEGVVLILDGEDDAMQGADELAR